MPAYTWQKSSYCAQGESCVHVAATAETVHLTESGDPAQSILSTDRDTFGALLRALRENHD
ncbi:DUF397 domain-containing protein [Streptomyces sp. NPDC088747]|uniref:DUF397 domain-containing protein n=1 Tax=Streptomyces sp. NPDC088747 TaxID=3365886 RepID=UPI0038026F9D